MAKRGRKQTFSLEYLLQIFELKRQGYKHREIADELKMSNRHVGNVFTGHYRPEVRKAYLRKWGYDKLRSLPEFLIVKRRGVPQTQKTAIANRRVFSTNYLLQIFSLRDKGFKFDEISDKLRISSSHVGNVFRGVVRPEVRETYLKRNTESKFDEFPSNFEEDDLLDVFLLRDEGYRPKQIANELCVNINFVRDVLYGMRHKNIRNIYERAQKTA